VSAVGLRLEVLLGISLVACGSPTSGHPSADAGSDDAVSADVATACLPLTGPGCGKGETCCLSGLTGACVDRLACTSPLQFACSGPHACGAGQVCCASVPLGLDASVLGSEGGKPILVGVTASSACAASCPAPSFALCSNSSDCPGGTTCGPLPEGDLVSVALGGEAVGVCSADAGASTEAGGLPEAGAPVTDASTERD
jgi:hypothetical protein